MFYPGDPGQDQLMRLPQAQHRKERHATSSSRRRPDRSPGNDRTRGSGANCPYRRHAGRHGWHPAHLLVSGDAAPSTDGDRATRLPDRADRQYARGPGGRHVRMRRTHHQGCADRDDWELIMPQAVTATTAATVDFIGAGWSYPLGTDATGGVALVNSDRELEQAIRLILGTAVGERPMRPEFGCRIHDHVFNTATSASAGQIAYDVRQAL